MTIRQYRDTLPWLGLGLFLVGLVQGMAVVPALELFSASSQDYLHENMLGLMLMAVAIGIMVWQPISTPVIASVCLAAVAASNIIFSVATASYARLLLGLLELLVAAALIRYFWRRRIAVRQYTMTLSPSRLHAAALTGAGLAALIGAYAASGHRLDPRLWYVAVSLAVIGVAAGTAALIEQRRQPLLAVVALALAMLVLVPFYLNLLP